MNQQADATAFIDKWRSRWPEWSVAGVFVPEAQRARALAWFALRQELTDAAWGGQDLRPGEAKLAWWSEELQGWAQGRRRHPLGQSLQREPAPWISLAASLPALLASHERPVDTDEAVAVLEPFAEGVAAISAALFAAPTPAPARSVVIGLLAERLLAGDHAAVPLQSLARVGAEAGPEAALRDWAAELLRRWPPPHEGAVPGRLHAVLVRNRLRRIVAGRARPAQAPAWTVLLPAWRAARG